MLDIESAKKRCEMALMLSTDPMTDAIMLALEIQAETLEEASTLMWRRDMERAAIDTRAELAKLEGERR